MQLLDLIQTTVAPSSWQPYGPGSISVFGGGGGAAGGGRSGARRLVDVIQENVRPQTWDVNGGYGTISCVAAEVRERGEPRAKSREESGGARWKGCG
jgi:hypothetical protein